jgi:hypothetical protein
LQQILIYLFLLLFGKTNNVVVAFFHSASTDADVCIDRRGCLHRPTRMSASTDADVCTDRRGCLHRPMRMLASTDADAELTTKKIAKGFF